MIGLVLVSHSAALATGLAELVGQMAPAVPVVPAGGDVDGGLGTSADRVADAMAAADRGAGVVVLYDLGSARMAAELALEFAEPELADRTRLVDASFVEGAVAAGAAAAGEQALDQVAAAARTTAAGGPAADGAPAPTAAAQSDGTAAVTERLVLTDPAGLHARPSAAVVRALAGLDATVTVTAGDVVASAASLSALLRLAAPVGTEVLVAGSGRDAALAVPRVVAALSSATGEQVPAETVATRPGVVGAAPGRRSGPLHRPGAAGIEPPAETFAGAATERGRLAAALRQAGDQLVGGGDITEAHRVLLADPELTGAADELIGTGVPAASAWWRVVRRTADQLAASGDAVIAGRAVDVVDVGQRVLGALLGRPVRPEVPAGAVLLADDLAPSLVPELVEAGVVGFVLRAGGVRGHAAVLARAAGVPMVVAAGDTLDAVPDGTPVLVDGGTGEVLVSPDESAAVSTPPARTVPRTTRIRRSDGGELRLSANVGSVADAEAAVAAGAAGVGLVRTELAFTGRSALPDEDEQVEWLSAVLAACPEGPVVVRTVDLGGDKPVPGLRLDPVRHGFLGERGLRLCLARPALFATHLRAVLRAAAMRPIELMFPFVTEPAELAAARSALAAAVASLRADGTAYAEPTAVGIMVEIPTAALRPAPFLPDVDFVSVGSNDLVQYLTAADRTVPEVAAVYRAGEALVPDLVAGLVAAAAPAGVPVAVCGDLAGDPEYAALLRTAGVAELSMAAPLLAGVRAALAD
ncbi:dihydroxyacetone kinase phosphoryl donor subunit DhaM [Actinocatenispora comari]|uniref:Phosphocarrier protein HPr n=1 Tax=Actinocatenispora comari TaxID=2807577 RepID=A0A8J4AFA3_9ACTN|nr:dihydroxyacetone kinase phosphoryl donor subunit DhaM [Actinocatenispora comari]GIL30254.1 multiphosphoryl transfer protein [Actinocatenispora comari]